MFAKKCELVCPAAMVDYLIREHFSKSSRPLRRCHARDLLEQIIYFCDYHELPTVINEQNLDHAVRNYFTALKGT
jgi:Fe-S-cluster-containing hydrogenase component 2